MPVITIASVSTSNIVYVAYNVLILFTRHLSSKKNTYSTNLTGSFLEGTDSGITRNNSGKLGWLINTDNSKECCTSHYVN